jgi:metal-dependent amidase/aminoacylase/carboxypeptidase family protein
VLIVTIKEGKEEMKPIMAGEDFANYLQEVPGCFFLYGRVDVDEDALSVGLEGLLATYLQYAAAS